MGPMPKLWIEANYLRLIEAVMRILNEGDHNMKAPNPLFNPLSMKMWLKIASDEKYGFLDKKNKTTGASALKFQWWRLVKAYTRYPSKMGPKFPTMSAVIRARLDIYSKLNGSLYDLGGGQMPEVSTDTPRNTSDGDADLAAGQIPHTLTNIPGTSSDGDIRLGVQNADNATLVTGDGSNSRVRSRTEPHASRRRLRSRVALPEASTTPSRGVSFDSKSKAEEEEMQISEDAFAVGSRCTSRAEEEMQGLEGVSAGGTMCTSRAEEEEMLNIPGDGHPKQVWGDHKFPVDMEALKKLLQIREKEATDLKEWCHPRMNELSDQKIIIDTLREAHFNKRAMVLREPTSFDTTIKALSFELMCARVSAAYENCRNLVTQIFTAANQEVLDAVETLGTQCLVRK